MIYKNLFLLVAILGIILGTSVMASANDIVSKRTLTNEKTAAINNFWQAVKQASFTSHDKVNIAYATNFKRPDSAYIVIVPGRSESYLKYQELAYDLDQQGYDSVIIDHRGQGLSTRLTNNRLQGYVEKFDHYAQDLNQLLSQELVKQYPKHQSGAYMLAHSMGGAIALRYLQLYDNKIKAISLSAPMIAISSGGIPVWLAKAIMKTGTTVNRWLSDTPWYFFGQGNVNKSTFEENRLMHSAERFHRFQSLYHNQPELKLGGVTFNWLAQAMINSENLFIDIEKISLPVQMLQAGNELIVDNIAQNSFCAQLHRLNAHSCPSGKPIVIENAYHELLFELDLYRDNALEHILEWFSKYP